MSKWRDRYKVHPAADWFRMMSDQDLKALGEDIKAHGLGQPVVITTVKDAELICDGRNRLEAMDRAGLSTENIDRVYIEYDAAAAFVLSANLLRRHLSKREPAAAIVAAVKAERKLCQLGTVSVSGGRGKKNPVKADALKVNAALPKEQQVSTRSIQRELSPREVASLLHPNAPLKLRAKAKRQKARESLKADRQLLATLPRNLQGARNYYLRFVAMPGVDLNAEMTLLVDAIQKLVDREEA
jgi:ParB-like chromosome segregation protein Spo0J